MLQKILFGLVFIASLLLSPAGVYAQSAQRSNNDDLMYRISFGRVEDVKLLLDKGAEPNTYGAMGDTPIILAITRNQADSGDMIKALLAKGADPNFPDKNGIYPLEMAIKSNKPDLIGILIAGGADIHMKAMNGMTMIDLANQTNKPDITKVMMDKVQKEADQEAQLHQPERLLSLIHEFSGSICEMNYWNNYLMSEQNPKDNVTTREKMEKDQMTGEKVAREIVTYFPSVKLDSYVTYASTSVDNIFKSLPSLKERAASGIGSDEDAHKRCLPIADAARAGIAQALDAQKEYVEKVKHQNELMGNR